MAYQAGYQYGYGDADTGYTFSPSTATGVETPIIDYNEPAKRRDMLWRLYDLPSQVHIFFNSGVSSTKTSPTVDAFAAADTGSGKGDRMVWPSPGGPYPITASEAQTIIDDSTYADEVGGGIG